MKTIIQTMFDRMKENFTLWDYSFLKFYGFLFGLIIGANFPAFVKNYEFFLASIFLVLLTRYSYLMFFKKNRTGNFSAENMQ